MTPLRNWIGHEPSARCTVRHQSNAARAGSIKPATVSAIGVLDVIPRVGVAAVEPRQRTRGFLGRGNRPRRLQAVVRRQNSGHTGNLEVLAPLSAYPLNSGFRKYERDALADHRVQQRLGRYG